MPGVVELRNILDSNVLGKLHNIKIDFGHGGAPGDEKSWKLDPIAAGGGVLLDPGVHIFDLLLHLLGAKSKDFELIGINSWSGFWKTGVEESVDFIGNINQTQINVAISIVAWRTRFRVEILGENGYAILNGRGRSDGPQTLTIGKRWAWLDGSSQLDSERTVVHIDSDVSISTETKAWLGGGQGVASVNESLEVMKFYDQLRSHLHE